MYEFIVWAKGEKLNVEETTKAQSSCKFIALLFLQPRRRWGGGGCSALFLFRFTYGKDPVLMVQVAGRARARPVWTGAENLDPTGIRSLDPPPPTCKESLYQLRHLGPHFIEYWSLYKHNALSYVKL